MKIVADAEKTYLEKISETIGAENAAKVLLAQKAIDGFNVITSNPSDKVYVPSNIGGLISLDK